MKKYILKRLLISVFTLFFIILILFVLMDLMPGTPFNDEKLSPEMIAVLYKKYGLDQPMVVRFFKYLTNMIKGDFGVSYVIAQNMPIADLLKSRFAVTVHIALQDMTLGTLTGLLLGTLAAVYHNSFLDPFVSFISMLGASVPSYVFALGMIYFIAYKAKLFPILYTSKSPFLSVVLPTIALSLGIMANIARFTRTQMIEVLGSEFMLLAETTGSRKWEAIFRHALRNSLIPLLTIIAPMLVSMMFGSMLMESIFSIPGIGSLFIQSIQVNDYNVVITLSFIYSALYIGVMLIVDILYGVIDPRVRVAKRG